VAIIEESEIYHPCVLAGSQLKAKPGLWLNKNIAKEQPMKFIVIGGDAAGMSAASRAKRSLTELDVTVLEKTADVSYSA